MNSTAPKSRFQRHTLMSVVKEPMLHVAGFEITVLQRKTLSCADCVFLQNLCRLREKRKCPTIGAFSPAEATVLEDEEMP